MYSNIANAVVNEDEGCATAGNSAIDWYIASASEGEAPSCLSFVGSEEGEVGTLGVRGRWRGFLEVHLKG